MRKLGHKVSARLEQLLGLAFPGSRTYWDRRYAFGGLSGAGSYGRLATFKAEVLNGFVSQQGIRSVLELGCGDGNQLSLASYPSYVGIDVSPEAVKRCRRHFGNDPTKRFATGLTKAIRSEGFDLSLSLDVVYHLIEDRIFEQYMADLFDVSRRFVIVYASNVTMDEFLGRFPTVQDPHVRHRHFTDWVSLNRPEWRLELTVPNAYPFDPEAPNETSFADFFVFAKSS